MPSTYHCNYDYVDIDGLKHEVRGGACFAQVYREIWNVKSMVIYILKDYQKLGYEERLNCNRFTFEEKRDYIGMLQLLGFKLNLRKKPEIIKLGKSDNFKQVEATAIDVLTSENSSMGNLLILNLVRYLYEGNGSVVTTMLKWSKTSNHSGVNHYNRFMLAHYANPPASCHSIYTYYNAFRMLTKAEFTEKILKNPAHVTALDQSLPVLGSNREMKSHVRANYECGKTLSQIYLWYIKNSV